MTQAAAAGPDEGAGMPRVTVVIPVMGHPVLVDDAIASAAARSVGSRSSWTIFRIRAACRPPNRPVGVAGSVCGRCLGADSGCDMATSSQIDPGGGIPRGILGG